MKETNYENSNIFHVDDRVRDVVTANVWHILSDNSKAGYYLVGEVIDDALSGKEKAIWHSETDEYQAVSVAVTFTVLIKLSRNLIQNNLICDFEE